MNIKRSPSGKKHEEGVTMIEYALIAALVAIAAVTVLGLLGTELTTIFTTITDSLKSN